jgi:hypothetical protein
MKADAGGVMPWWLRLYLLLGMAQGLSLGITGLVAPGEMQIPLRISPLNARVAAAMYTAAALGLLVAAVGRRAHARLLVLCFALATTVILIVTLLHWTDFMAAPLPHRPLWLTAYVVDPILGLLSIPAAGFLRPAAPRHHALTWPLRIAAVVLAAPGVALLFVPTAVAAIWPWALPPVLAQVYGSFFVAFAAAGWLASSDAHPQAVRIVVIVLFTLAVLVLLASSLHLARFKPGPPSWLWFGGFALLGVVFGVALLRDALASVAARGALPLAGGAAQSAPELRSP